jgi:hypothetical protein
MSNIPLDIWLDRNMLVYCSIVYNFTSCKIKKMNIIILQVASGGLFSRGERPRGGDKKSVMHMQ